MPPCENGGRHGHARAGVDRVRSGTRIALRCTAMSAGAAFQDGLGERRQTTGAGNQLLDLVIVHEAIGGVAGFEAALRQRAGELASFQHTSFPRLKGVGRLSKTPSRIVVATEHVSGVRLSDLLAIAERRLIPLEYEGALGLLRQLLAAVADLHQSVPHVSHGAIAPERLVFTPDAKLIIVDQVFGSAIERLGFDQERCWRELRVAVPQVDGKAAFDRRADVTQIGVVGLSLLVGRLLSEDEYPASVADMVEGLNAISANGLKSLPAEAKTWLRRALQLDATRSFATASDARAEFDKSIAFDETRARQALTAFLTGCQTFGKSSATAEASAPPATVKADSQGASAAAAVGAFAAAPAPPAAAAQAKASPPHVPTVPSADERKPRQADAELPLLVKRRIRYWDSPWRNKIAAAAALVVAVATAGTFAVRSYATAPAMGKLTVNTNPDGAQVSIDGEQRGLTPLTLELPSGDHSLELGLDNQTRVIPISITTGGHVSQFVELPKTASALGQLSIRTDPPGATVVVDGQRRGVTPLVVADLMPGTHNVGLSNALSSVTEQVKIESGATASLVVPLTAPQGVPVSGWVSVTTPVEMQIFEDGRLIGSSRSDRIMMSVGEHNVQIVNEALGYRSGRTIRVNPGAVTPIRVDVPKGSLALNAAPWAEVWVNGDRLGETPIGNVSLPIGSHDVLFRHPDLGEQRHTVTVTMNAPARLSVDMRRRQ